MVLFLTLEVVLFLTLERPKSGTKTNSPALFRKLEKAVAVRVRVGRGFLENFDGSGKFLSDFREGEVLFLPGFGGKFPGRANAPGRLAPNTGTLLDFLSQASTFFLSSSENVGASGLYAMLCSATMLTRNKICCAKHDIVGGF